MANRSSRFRDRRNPKKSVVYTCLFGYSEAFLDIPYERDDDIDFVVFTDDKTLRSDFWEVRLVSHSLLDPARQSKHLKHCAHEVFPNHQESLYVDNTVRLTKEPREIFRYLEDPKFSLIMFGHLTRDCVYEEARVLVELELDDPAVIEAQMEYYRSLGYPERNGLHATTVLLRRHNEPALREAMDEWDRQVLRHSKRDQLSFDVVRHFRSLPVGRFPGSIGDTDLVKWPYFPSNRRLPRNFDDRLYLELNPDVAAAGMNARKHYLKFGIDEGRPFRGGDGAAPSVKMIEVDHDDERGRALASSPTGRLNEATFQIWQALLNERAWTDIIDIGANYGEMLVGAQFPVDARILAIEPNLKLVPFLLKNISKQSERITCLSVAVSDHDGLAELIVDTKWSGLSSLRSSTAELSDNQETVLVPTLTLESLLGAASSGSDRNLLVKIDVEGHEVPVFKGGEAVIKKSTNFVGLTEVLHLQDEDKEWLLSNFDVDVYNIETESFTRISPSTTDRFKEIMSEVGSYQNDVVVRKRPISE